MSEAHHSSLCQVLGQCRQASSNELTFASPPSPHTVFAQFFSIRFPHHLGFLEQGRSTSDSRRRTSVATTLYSRRERSEGRENLCSLLLVSHPLLVSHALRSILFCFVCTSFSGHRPAQREWARTGLIGPMQGAIPTQSNNP